MQQCNLRDLYEINVVYSLVHGLGRAYRDITVTCARRAIYLDALPEATKRLLWVLARVEPRLAGYLSLTTERKAK